METKVEQHFGQADYSKAELAAIEASKDAQGRIPVMFCGGATGRVVIYCRMPAFPEPNKSYILHNARMVLYWPKECNGLLGLAAKGAKTGLRLTSSVPVVTDICRQALIVSKEAAKSIEEWPDEP